MRCWIKLRRVVVFSIAAAVWMCPDVLLAQPAASGSAQVFPARLVRYVVPFGAGASPDIVARLMADRLTRLWGQQVIVENRVGAAGVLGTAFVAKLPPDGHTIVQCNVASSAIAMSLFAKMPYDQVRDLAQGVRRLCTGAPRQAELLRRFARRLAALDDGVDRTGSQDQGRAYPLQDRRAGTDRYHRRPGAAQRVEFPGDGIADSKRTLARARDAQCQSRVATARTSQQCRKRAFQTTTCSHGTACARRGHSGGGTRQTARRYQHGVAHARHAAAAEQTGDRWHANQPRGDCTLGASDQKRRYPAGIRGQCVARKAEHTAQFAPCFLCSQA